MNYLAHLYLAEPTPPSLLGNLMGDFMRGERMSALPGEVQAGIRMHREVDAYTDRHPVAARSRSRIAEPYRRYAGVLVDVFYDHFLARSWDRFSPDLTLPEFTGRVYPVLLSQRSVMTERLRDVAPRMAEYDWLASYGDAANIERALQGMSRRMKHRNPLPQAIGELHDHRVELERDFLEFFPQLVEHVARETGRSSHDLPPRLPRPGEFTRHVV